MKPYILFDYDNQDRQLENNLINLQIPLMEITFYNLTHIFLILMQKFLGFKAKIIRSKRQSQRVEEEDIFYLIRRHQHIKTIKKNRSEIQNTRNGLKFTTLPKTVMLRDEIDNLQEASVENQTELGPIFQKQESTLQSVNSSAEKSPSKLFALPLLQASEEQRQLNGLNKTQQVTSISPIINSKQKFSSCSQTNFKSAHYPYKNSQIAIIPQKIRIYEDSDEKVNPTKIFSLIEYPTTREMLQLDSLDGAELMGDTPLFQESQTSNIQVKFSGLNAHDYQNRINRFDEDKIQMLFREEYKQFFLSSLSSIPNREDESLNTLKSQFQFSNQFQQSPQGQQATKTSKFDKIWNFFSKKEKNNFISDKFQSDGKKPSRQKMMNLQQNKPLPKKLKQNAAKPSKNDKKQDVKKKRGIHSVKK